MDSATSGGEVVVLCIATHDQLTQQSCPGKAGLLKAVCLTPQAWRFAASHC